MLAIREKAPLLSLPSPGQALRGRTDEAEPPSSLRGRLDPLGPKRDHDQSLRERTRQRVIASSYLGSSKTAYCGATSWELISDARRSPAADRPTARRDEASF